jgi:eukaryotic-like serine/threonine-protein kinase
MSNILHSHYKIIRVLGLGKSGITYLGEDLDVINSPLYIIKEIQYVNNNGSVPRSLEQLFEVQGTIAYRVGQHPQIPSLIAKFEENGNRYLVREYIDGDLLDGLLTPGIIWTQAQVFDLLMDLVGILSFIHSFQYIHQDINPSNIIRSNEDGRFNLIGFSAIKDVENIDSSGSIDYQLDPRNTSYVPYEQAQNAPHFNSDLHAVGAIAIQALTGKFPLDRDPDSYEFNWRDRLNVDRKLIDIINRMVRPDYRNRYQSALEVLTDLQAFALNQVAVSKFDRLNPYLIFSAAACILLCGLGFAKILSASVDRPQLTSSTIAVQKKSAPSIVSNVNWHKYVDKTTGIKIKYADTWQQDPKYNGLTGVNIIFNSPQQTLTDKYRENVSIRVEELTDPQTSLSNYTKSAIAEINKSDRTAKIVESSSITLAQRPANLLIYTSKDENSLPIKNLKVWTILHRKGSANDGGKVYILTYKAEPERYYQSLETAMSMINSFELTD